jgi:hypothetical protein
MIVTHGTGLLLLLLLSAHALADFPLQTRFLAEGKNRHSALGRIYWPYALSAHALIHGGFVGALTGSVALGVAEVVLHWVTDWLKCDGHIGLAADQAIHIGCKVTWALAVLAFFR